MRRLETPHGGRMIGLSAFSFQPRSGAVGRASWICHSYAGGSDHQAAQDATTKKRSGVRRPTPTVTSTSRRPLACSTVRNSASVQGLMVKK